MAQKVEMLILNAEKRKEGEGLVVLIPKCPECGKQHFIGMTMQDFKDLQNGFVDSIFAEEDPDVRELLITGICPECWDKLFPEDNE